MNGENKRNLTTRLTDLFGHRSLASALFCDAQDLADSLVEHLGADQSGYEGDKQAILHEVTECIEFALARKMESVQDDPRYAEITGGLIAAVGRSVEISETPAELKASLENSFGWGNFIDYMREKAPINGFGELAVGHLDAVSEQAILLKKNELRLSNRSGGFEAIGRATLMSLAKLTEAGTIVELRELASAVANIYARSVFSGTH
jgi:hypothetical protein